jgi:hypothetical protein
MVFVKIYRNFMWFIVARFEKLVLFLLKVGGRIFRSLGRFPGLRPWMRETYDQLQWLGTFRLALFNSSWLFTNDRHIRTRRFVLIIVLSIKITAFCPVTPCNLVDGYQHFGETYCLHPFLSWRWQQVSPQCWHPFIKLYGVISQKVVVLKNETVPLLKRTMHRKGVWVGGILRTFFSSAPDTDRCSASCLCFSNAGRGTHCVGGCFGAQSRI